MTEFRECLMDAALIHLPFTGCPFTWHNCSSGSRSLWRRLDRALVNDTWLEKWPNSSYLSALPQTSDHSPLILLGAERRLTGGVFRFDNFLTSQPGFLTSVRQVWRHRIYGTAMYGVTRKLKALKPVFRAQRKAKGDLAQNVCLAKGFLEKAQGLLDEFKDDFLLQLVQWCRTVYCRAVVMEDNMLRQRAKLRWLKDGDRCTRVFFRKINATRAKMRVFQITSAAGEVLTETDQRQRPLFFLFPGEIKEVFFDISEDSAPGPDGFTSSFFKAAWPEIGEDICAAVKEFFLSGRLLKQINATVLVLIPKVQTPTRVSEFRPIACCNVLYKAISKILVRRMQQVLHSLVDFSQNAFVPGRSIADNILLAQELLSGYNQTRLPKRCTIKIDIQKAYDSVRWDFLLETLHLFKFPLQFISWIEQCVTTAAFSIALNGQLHGFFKGTKGLRQGDPSSPYLFVLVMEGCTFCPATKRGVRGICSIIWPTDWVRVQSYFQELYKERQDILNTLGFQEGCLPIKYLGVPLTASRLTVEDCQPILNKITSRLAGWTHLNLSLAGRAQLLKSVLGSLHMYWASVFLLPKSIIRGIEQLMRSFLERETQDQEDQTSIWVSWVLRYRLRNQPIWTVNISSASWSWRKLVKASFLLKEGLDYRVGDGHKFRLWTDYGTERASDSSFPSRTNNYGAAGGLPAPIGNSSRALVLAVGLRLRYSADNG
ncbi:UNVERIFIED_CONTAM: hypothetical protein Sradi_6838000 [Sesamum radiatum]|uniref:Reverse transcriptase domain-containing protein n=1 Tax=Sesamum radiatum TaxID=300843 RepID=A0AAW2JP35_SESRA